MLNEFVGLNYKLKGIMEKCLKCFLS